VAPALLRLSIKLSRLPIKNTVINFIKYGIFANTLKLGAGERGALVLDYFEGVGRGNIDWQDLDNLASGKK